MRKLLKMIFSHGGRFTSSKCRIARIIFDHDACYRDFTYDSEGRITSYLYTPDGKKSSSWKCSYRYGPGLIVSTDHHLANDRKDCIIRHTIEDGLIRKTETGHEEPRNIFYEYDSDRQLIRMTIKIYHGDKRDKTEVHENSFIWADGNISQIQIFRSRPVKVGYTRFENTLRIVCPLTMTFKFNDMDEILSAEGYYGKHPRNLPSYVEGWYSFDYNGFSKDGYAAEYIKSDIENPKDVVEKAIFVWK